MKRLSLPKLAGASAVALSLALTPLALPAAAQTSPDGTAQTTTDPAADRDFDWGWLGLLGLFGLAGLKGGQKQEDRDVNRSAYR